jgi:hypothetical protein
MAVDGEVSYTYNGTAWSYRPLPTIGFLFVSCSSSAFCAALGDDVSTFDGTGWGPTSPLVTTYGDAISCPATRTCVVVDQAGRAFRTPVS